MYARLCLLIFSYVVLTNNLLLGDTLNPDTASMYIYERFGVDTTGGDTTVSLIIYTDGRFYQLDSMGIGTGSSKGSRRGNTVHAHVPLNMVNDVFELESVSGLRFDIEAVYHTDVSVPNYINANPVWDDLGYMGSGIIFGLVDSGIDTEHEDFQNGPDDTRMLYLWDQAGSSGSPPEGFNYGSEYSKSDIDQGIYTLQNYMGHGTAVAGIAVGNGRASGANTYSGVAPEADIIGVVPRNFVGGEDIINGIAYIVGKADLLDKPCVINLSIGIEAGPKNGSSPIEIYVDSLLTNHQGKALAIVVAAGNRGYDPYNQEVIRDPDSYEMWQSHSRSYGDGCVTIDVPYSGFPLSEIRANIWYPNNSSTSVTFSATYIDTLGYSVTDTYGPYCPGDGIYHVGTAIPIHNLGYFGIHNEHYDESYMDPFPFTFDNLITIDAWDDWIPNGPFVDIDAGTWEVCLEEVSGYWDLYIYRQKIGSQKNATVVDWVNERRIADPGNALHVITVGSINSKNSWIDVDGTYRPDWLTPHFDSDGFPIDSISFFNSPGPTRDGIYKPEVYAPGAFIATPLYDGSDLSYERWLVAQNSQYVHALGTSFASPHVAGVIALMMEANPNISNSSIRECIINSVNPSTGCVDAVVAVQCADDGFVNEPQNQDNLPTKWSLLQNYPNPFNNSTNIRLRVPADEQYSGKETPGVLVKLEIYDILGRRIRELINESMLPGEYDISWDGTDNEGSDIASGVYFCRCICGNEMEVLKMIALK